jgi:YVTN family beta-propeller protein
MTRWVPRGGSRAARALAAGALLHALSAPVSAQICAYVANENDGTVSVIDAGLNVSTTTISVGGSPMGVAVTPSGTFVYVSNIDPDAVSVINASSGKIMQQIDLPECTAPLCGPEAVATGPNTAYVPGPVDDGSHVLSAIDTASNMVADSMTIQPDAVPRGGGVAVTADGSLACVSGYQLKPVAGQPQPDAVLYSHVLDIAAKSLVPRTTDLGQIESMEKFLDSARTAAAITPDGLCYVTDGVTGKVLVITLAGNTLVKEIPLGATLTGVAISPDGKSAYVSAGTIAAPPAPDEGQLFVIDTRTNMLSGTIRLRGHFLASVAVSPNGAFAMTTDRDSDRVFVIDTANNSLTAAIPVGAGPTGIAIASVADGCPTGGHCYGDCNLDGAVTIDELITAATVALQGAPVSVCKPADGNNNGRITIDEILRAVDNAMNGCPPAQT